MNTTELQPIGWGFTRISYRKLFWKLFRITQSGTHSIMCGFKAKRLFGNFWWVDLKSFRAYCERYHGGTFDKLEYTREYSAAHCAALKSQWDSERTPQ